MDNTTTLKRDSYNRITHVIYASSFNLTSLSTWENDLAVTAKKTSSDSPGASVTRLKPINSLKGAPGTYTILRNRYDTRDRYIMHAYHMHGRIPLYGLCSISNQELTGFVRNDGKMVWVVFHGNCGISYGISHGICGISHEYLMKIVRKTH